MALSVEEAKQVLHDRVSNDVAYHAPNEEAVQRHELIRTHTEALAHLYVELCPPGRELSLALTKLIDEAMARANAAIARNHNKLRDQRRDQWRNRSDPHPYEGADINKGTSLPCCQQPRGAEIHQVGDEWRP